LYIKIQEFTRLSFSLCCPWIQDFASLWSDYKWWTLGGD